MLVFRVECSGPRISDEAQEALTAVGARWEGSATHGDRRPDDHRVLIPAPTDDAAVAAVAAALEASGEFHAFAATSVRNSRGEPQNTPIRTQASEIDWNAFEARERLTQLQQVLVQTILDAAEPTWKLLADPDVPDDQELVEAAMRDLEARGLVASTWEPSGDSSNPRQEMCWWWVLTDEAWDLLGLIKSPRYH